VAVKNWRRDFGMVVSARHCSRISAPGFGDSVILAATSPWEATMRRLLVAVAVSGSICVSAQLALAQPQSAQPQSSQTQPSQTARQALIEMFFGTAANHMEKHLPDATRKTLHRMGSASGEDVLAQLSMFSMQAKMMGPGFQTFDTGSTLLTAEEPGARDPQKVELTVERDDLVGDEDQIELALHLTKNGKEDTTLPFVPRFTFSMKMESDVWRLNEISVTVRVPLADPDFLKGIEDRERTQDEQMATVSMHSVATAEKSYEALHGNYACSLSTLSANGNSGGVSRPLLSDRSLASGKMGGYLYVITGCDAAHYKLVAEPVMADSGLRAFCSDESGSVRSSADGKARTCLSGGETVVPPLGIAAAAPYNNSAESKPIQSAEMKAKRVRVSQGVSQALVVSMVQPTYPDEAKVARIQGTVAMRAVIGKTGDVEKLELISGHPMLAPAAMDAVKQWKYKPYLLNGNAVEVETQVTVNFALAQQ
jgi:TonB family protein